MPAKEDYERFKSLAEELELEDDKAEAFVNDAMKRKGYKPSMVWNDPEPSNDGGDGDEGDFFGRRKKREEQKQQQQEQQQEQQQKEKSAVPYGY